MTPGRPGRPRGFNQDTVLTQVMDLFWRRAYAQVSVPDLSTCTGLSTSSIYNAFGSKHLLYLAALDRYQAMIDRLMLGPMSAGLTAALRRAAERGELPADEVDNRATALLGLVVAYNLLSGAGVPRDETDAVLAAATALLAPLGK
jgi:AcrR family transcriptional regulator